MTNSAQWGRVGEKGVRQMCEIARRLSYRWEGLLLKRQPCLFSDLTHLSCFLSRIPVHGGHKAAACLPLPGLAGTEPTGGRAGTPGSTGLNNKKANSQKKIIVIQEKICKFYSRNNYSRFHQKCYVQTVLVF